VGILIYLDSLSPAPEDIPPPPSISGMIYLATKSRTNLWGSITYGQNLEPQGLSVYVWGLPAPLIEYAVFRNLSQGWMNIAEVWKSPGGS